MNRFLNTGKPHDLRRFALSVIILLIAAAVFYYAVDSISESTMDRQRESLENAVHDSVVYCYALEGMYPEDVAYLEDNYGLTYDHEKFYVGYRLHGSNIMPDITIIDLEE